MRQKVLVCGSRGWRDGSLIRKRLTELKPGFLLIHGGAHGADTLAAEYAKFNGYHAAEVKPLWDSYGKRAGYLRNVAMLDLSPDLVIAFWDGKSPGTWATIDEARKRGIEVEVITLPDPVPAVNPREEE